MNDQPNNFGQQDPNEEIDLTNDFQNVRPEENQPDYSSAKGQSYSPYEGVKKPQEDSSTGSNTSNNDTPKYTSYSNYQVYNKPEKKKKSTGFKVGMSIIAVVVVLALIVGAVFTGFIIGSSRSKIKSQVSGSKDEAKVETNPSINYETSSDTPKAVADGTVAGCAAVAVDSVVEIVTESVATDYFYGQYVTSGAGSGVIIDSTNGYIITCAHVVESSTSIKVTLTNEKSYDAVLVGADSESDIAVIKIKPENLTSASIGDSDKVVLGENAVAIGNPLGTLGGTVTSGIISALDREIKIDGVNYHLFQIDTAINPGNSGGGLFDINGNLIGIVNAKSSNSSSSSATIEGIGFAIPVNRAMEVANELVSNGYITGRPALGITCMDVTTSTSSSKIYSSGLYNYVTDYGVYFTGYSDGQSGDLQFGDRIVAFNGTSVSSMSDIKSLLSDCEVGQTVKLTVSRKSSDMKTSQLVEVNVTLIEAKNNETPQETTQSSYYNPFN